MHPTFSKLISAIVVILMGFPSGVCCGLPLSTQRFGEPEQIVWSSFPGLEARTTSGSGKRCCHPKLTGDKAQRNEKLATPVSAAFACHSSSGESNSEIECCCGARIAEAPPIRPVAPANPIRFLGFMPLASVDSAIRQAIAVSRFLPLPAVPLTGTARQALLNVWRN